MGGEGHLCAPLEQNPDPRSRRNLGGTLFTYASAFGKNFAIRPGLASETTFFAQAGLARHGQAPWGKRRDRRAWGPVDGSPLALLPNFWPYWLAFSGYFSVLREPPAAAQPSKQHALHALRPESWEVSHHRRMLLHSLVAVICNSIHPPTPTPFSKAFP